MYKGESVNMNQIRDTEGSQYVEESVQHDVDIWGGDIRK